MAKTRSYKLLCPIARALDRIGDRWTLLILRDLHAGPARFTDLQRGLTGIAANLLTERLTKLVADGLVARQEGAHGAALYRLTELGKRTGDTLFELAMFGGLFPLEGAPVAPGNLRTVAFTLGAAAKRVVTGDMAVSAMLLVDGEEIALTVGDGTASAAYGPAEDPDVVVRTSYDPLLAVSEGEMTEQEFVARHCAIEVRTPGKDQTFLRLMSAIMARLRA